ncbi:MAG: hypothetical protein WCB46_08725 [Methanoregula sp.]
MDFKEAEQQKQQLSVQLAGGQISPAAYLAAINAIRVTDSSGRWWQPNPQGSGWLYWDGKTWIPGTPAATGAKAPARELMSMDEFRKISKEVPLAKRPQKWWDLLSIFGGVIAAALWFLYGGLREGFDIFSAILMIIMPVVLVIFRANIDEILLPIQPTRKRFHRLLLIGIGIVSPFLTAWILYNIFHISQYPLMQANIIVGTLVSYAIVRDPLPLAGSPKAQKPVAAAGVSIIFCILIISALVVPVMADDCTRDPLNAQDCLRTAGFAEIMAGLVAAILAGLINGPTILQTFLQNAATNASPAAQSLINQTVLTGDLQNLITKLAAEGKYVSNATLGQKAWYNFPVKAQLSDWVTGSERLHCEEAAKYGEGMLKTLQSQFGKDVKMGQIFIERNPLMNHTANVFQLPSGEKYIVDVWRSLIDGKPAIYNQADWVKVWNAELGGSPTVDVTMF